MCGDGSPPRATAGGSSGRIGLLTLHRPSFYEAHAKHPRKFFCMKESCPRRACNRHRQVAILLSIRATLEDHGNLAIRKLCHVTVRDSVTVNQPPWLNKPARTTVITFCNRQVSTINTGTGRAPRVRCPRGVAMQGRCGFAQQQLSAILRRQQSGRTIVAWTETDIKGLEAKPPQ